MINHMIEHPRCAVWAGMGSGKTGATLHALQAIDLMDEGPGLIIGPKRVARDVWPTEVHKWSTLAGTEVVPILGMQTQRLTALGRKAKWYSINYDNLPWLLKTVTKANWPFRTIISDEATRLKGMREGGQGGTRTNALAKVAWHPNVKRFVELTGTPAPNGLKDLWGQVWYLDRGKRLGTSYTAFKQRWFGRPQDGYSIEPFPFAQEQIQERIADLCLTIDPRDYMDIAEPIESDIIVELPAKAMDIYRKMERQCFVELEHALGTHEIEAVNAAVKTNKCLQIAAGAIYHDDSGAFTDLHDAKLEALDSIREEANGMPLLISYIFKSDLARMKRAFPQLRGIDDIEIADWNAGKVPMLAAHPASAGHGLNLQEGSNILVDFSSGWDLEYDDQIVERVGPMRQFQSGLNRPVYRYRIMAHGTMDFLVKARRTTKRSVQSILLDAMKRKGNQ